MSMTTRDKLNRLLHPTCAEDYGLVISLREVFKEEPEIFAREFAPFLPAHVIEQCQPTQDEGEKYIDD